MNKYALVSFVLLTAFVSALTLSPYAFSTVIFINNSPQPIADWGMGIFALYAITFSFLSVVILVRRTNKVSGIEKEQLRFMNYGIMLMLGLIITTILIPVILFNNSLFVPMAPFYTLFFLGSTTYAIIKHRLMDVRLVVTKTVSFTLLLGLFAILYALLFANLSLVFNTNASQFTSVLISTILSLAMLLSFQPIQKIIEKITDKVFYRDHYNTNTLLHSLARIMASTYSLTDLSHLLLKEITQQMRLSKGAIIITSDHTISNVVYEGYKDPPNFNIDKIVLLRNLNYKLIYEDLTDDEVKNVMREMDFGYAANLINADRTIGMLCLGSKLSGDTFTPDDIRVLETFSSEAAVAIENAKSYEEIRRFNITLKEEVDKATKDLQNANSRLQVLDKLKDEFVSLASHELRTPMTAIKSYLWLFLQNKEIKLNEKQKQYIERAYQATDRLINLVNDMLNVSRIESGRMNILIKPFYLPKLIREVIDELTPAAEKQGVSISHNISGANIPLVLADQNKIREVLINLIGNSIKFTSSGGKIYVDLAKNGTEIVTKIIDTGKGIKSEDIPKLFHKFQTVGNNYLTKMNTQGTGLGLYLSKSIVEMNNGKIWAESDGEDKGAIFSFSLNTV